MNTNTAYKEWVADTDETILILDKADASKAGKVTLDDIYDNLNEYKRLFKAGIASPAEIVTLSRAYPEISKYANVVDVLDLTGENEPVVVGGPASVELIDREGHLITSDALKGAFQRYMDNFRTRNVMVMHSDVQVGHALPAYISKSGQIFKSGVNEAGLFFVAELRNDTKIANKVGEQINNGKMKSYSIAGSATKTQNITKGANSYMQVDDMELAEVTICEKGVNQGAHFELMKSIPTPTKPVEDDTMYVISKNEVPTMKEIFDAWVGKAESKGLLAGKQMAVLENVNARQMHHRSLLDEMGFPEQQDVKDIHHPVDYDDPKDPTDWRVVNQSGQELGDPNEEMYKALYKTKSSLLDDPRRMTGVAKGKKVEKILPALGALASMGASAAGKKIVSDHLQNEKVLPTVAAGMALADRAGKKRLDKSNGATALATQHNNPDRNLRMVQNGYWESILLGDDIEKGIGDVARAVGSKLGIGGGKKPSSLVTASGGSTREAPNVGIGPKTQPPSSFQTGSGALAERSKSPSTAVIDSKKPPSSSTSSGGIITPGSSSGAPKPGATIAKPSGIYSGAPRSAYQGGTPGGDARSTTTPKKNVTTPVPSGGRGMYQRKPMSQAGAGAGPTASQGSPSTSPESAAQTSGSAASGQAGKGGIYSRGQAGREQYTPPSRAERFGSAAKSGAQTGGSAVARLGQRFGAALGSGVKRGGAQVGRELGSAAKAGVKAGVGKLKQTAGESVTGVKEGVKREAASGDKAAKGLLGFGRALGRVGQAAVGSEPTIGRGSSDTGPGVRGVQQRFTPSTSGAGSSSSTSKPSGFRPTRTSSSNVRRPRTTSGRVGPVRYNVSQGGNAPSQSSVSVSYNKMLEMSPDTRIAKSTDIFKRVLTAEAPDETWTGERKERPVEVEKIAPLLAGAAKVAAPIVAGKIADKVLGQPKAAQ